MKNEEENGNRDKGARKHLSETIILIMGTCSVFTAQWSVVCHLFVRA